MEQEEPIHKGILLVPPVGKLLKKSWQNRYCLLFKASKFGIERLELYDSVDSKEYKIITLENCIKVNSKSPTTFAITTKTSYYEFGTLTEHSLNDWLSAIQSVAFPDEVSRITSIEEDNDLYCSSGEGVFNVRLHLSPVAIRCGLESKNYTLVLTSTAIQLRTIIDNKLLFTWPYCYIRRYGYKTGKFTFEAGRKCESGEGIFFLEHPNQQEIFRCLATKMKSMKKLLSGETTPPILDCGDVQLHAALTMEARSRTPLPPSPTIKAQTQDSTVSNIIQISSELDQKLKMKPLLDFSHAMKPQLPPDKPISKPMPSKPPRKYVPINKVLNDPEYEPVERSYDQIEYRNNAWQTMGVDSPSHTEQVTEDEEDQVYMSWGEVKREVEIVKQPLAPSVITQTSTIDLSDSYYDKLNFFGSTSKLNAKSGYKQVYPVPVNPVVETPSYNEYDEVQCIDMEPVRPADDSHLGYGKIRKDPGREALKEVKDGDIKKKDENVSHQFHNEEPYAVISKPKRV